MKRYSLEAWVRPGVQVGSFETDSFEELCEMGEAAKAKWPSCALAYWNNDEGDYCTYYGADDGFTEEQREKLPWY